MAKAHPNRFYETVSTQPDEDSFVIHLDGRKLKTPGKQTLRVDNADIAKIIAAEWEAQDEKIIPETMPVTRLINVAVELTPNNRPKLIEDAQSYAGTDLLCYRASHPNDLVSRQKDLWDPVLLWAKGKGIELETTDSVIAITQNPGAIEEVGKYAASLDNVTLTLFVHLTAVFGSAVLALAVLEKYISGSRAFELSRLDNIWQIEQWGEDEEATANAETLATEVKALCKIIGD